jgi:hypothetical protein
MIDTRMVSTYLESNDSIRLSLKLDSDARRKDKIESLKEMVQQRNEEVAMRQARTKC